MSETTRKLRQFGEGCEGHKLIDWYHMYLGMELAADVIEAVEAQVAEAVARVAALEKRTVAQIPQECPACTGEDAGTARGGTGAAARSVPNAEGSPAGSTSPAAPSAVPAPRGFRVGDTITTRFSHGPQKVERIEEERIYYTRPGDAFQTWTVAKDATLVRAAAAPEAPAEDAGLVERLAESGWEIGKNRAIPWSEADSFMRDIRRAVMSKAISALTAESRLCAPGEVARLKDELAEANGARFLNANAVRLQKARAEAAEETQRLRDAAISVCATSNTRDSAKRHRLDRSNPNWSHGYERVYEAVEREMCHRERAEAAEKELAEARAISAATAERVRNEAQIATELRHELDDANDRLTSQSRSIEEMHAEMVDLRAKLAAAEQALDVERRTSIDHDGKTFVHPTREARLTSTAESWSPWMRYHKQVEKERDALRAELDALRAKPRFRTRKVKYRKADSMDFADMVGKFPRGIGFSNATCGHLADAANALGFRRRVDGAK